MNLDDIITPEQDPAGNLSEMAANLRFEDIPPEDVDFVKRDILDIAGCILAGSTEQTAQDALETARSWNAGGRSRVFVYGDRMPAEFAAFVNGTMARARDMGDTGNEGGHICEWVVPALLSSLGLSDEKHNGRDFITAFVAGAEWGSREHICVKLTHHNLTTPGECAGPRYATAAVSKLFGFTKEQIWTAQGLAYCARPQSEMQKCNEGTSFVRLQHGYVCADAIKSVSLVRTSSRITAPKAIYMGPGGLLKNIKHGDVLSPDILTEGLGKRWMWREQVTMKPYAGCKYNHCEICGILNLMKEHRFTWWEIDTLHFTVSEGCRHVFEPHDKKWNPSTGEAGMFSAPYSIAYAAIHGDCFLEAYSDAEVQKNMADPAFRALMDGMSYDVDESLPSFDDYTITVTLKDGRTFSRQEKDLPGNVRRPMSWDEVEHKFWNATRFCAVDLGKEQYREIIRLCKNLEQLADMRELADAMTLG